MKKKLGIILIAGIFSSCQTIIKGALGVTEPTVQSDAAVRNYASIHYSDFNVYRVDSATMSLMLRQAYKPDWEPGFRPIQFVCFAPSGKIISQWASCEGKLQNTLSGFPPYSKYRSDSLKTFPDFSKGTKPILNATKPMAVSNSKYTYVVYWTTWTNRQSIKLIDNLTEYVAKNGGSKADILLVNIDNYTK